jgi:predicted dehydrogenase
MAILNLALVGAGRRGAGAHLPVIAHLADTYRLVAICDIDEAVAKQYADQYGATPYTSIRAMVASEDIDVVDVTVPGPAHHAVCVYLAREGKHVLCETPIAQTMRLADMMIDAAAEHGTVLEVAENYYRVPIERFMSEVISQGVIGDVSRIYRIFHEGGYHGMSMLRIRAGGDPTSILGVAHDTPVTPHTDRMKRHHTSERWSMGYLDFDNGATAVMMYSNVIHARSLGRKVNAMAQIHGTEGTIIEDAIHVVPAEDMESGAIAEAYTPTKVMGAVDGVEVVESIVLDLPGRTVTWENPLAGLPIREGQVAVADELLSVARAIESGAAPEYGAAAGRLDQEMNLAMGESSRSDRTPVTFPLREPTAGEERTHAGYQETYGVAVDDIDGLLDVFFPRR